jgi:outer membrane receptor for Fe3+-dicitrate
VNAQFGTTNGKTLTDAIAVFGDGSYSLNDRWTLNGGLRATREKKNGIAFNAGYANDQFSTPVVVLANYDKEATFNSIAPKIGIDFKIREGLLAYFTASRGFKSGGFNVRAQSTAFPQSAEPFDDEILDVGEIGLKSVLADGQLVLNSAAVPWQVQGHPGLDLHRLRRERRRRRRVVLRQLHQRRQRHDDGVEVEFDATPRAVDWFASTATSATSTSSRTSSSTRTTTASSIRRSSPTLPSGRAVCASTSTSRSRAVC